MVSVKAINIIKLKKEIRDYCYSKINDYTIIKSIQERSIFFYDITESLKSMYPKCKKKILFQQVGKIYGVSSQTLYRSIAAQKAVLRGLQPKKYASRTFSNIKYNKKRSL